MISNFLIAYHEFIRGGGGAPGADWGGGGATLGWGATLRWGVSSIGEGGGSTVGVSSTSKNRP